MSAILSREAILLTPWLQPGDKASGLENETVSNGFVARGDQQKSLKTVRGTIDLRNHRAEAAVLIRSLRVTLHTLNRHACLKQRAEARCFSSHFAFSLE